MKILHVITDIDPKNGGVTEAVRILTLELTAQGHQNEIACLDRQDAEYTQNSFLPVTTLGPTRSSWKYSQRLLPWLTEHLRRFDIVIVHGLWLYHCYAVKKAYSMLAKSRKDESINSRILPKLLIFPHGMLDPYFQRDKSRKLKSIRNFLYWLLVERKIFDIADNILFTSEGERLLANKSFRPYNPKSELVVGLGIQSPPQFSDSMIIEFQNKCPGLNNQPYLLFLSRIHEKKGVDMIVRAYIELLSEFSGHVPKLVVAGPGLESSYGKYIASLTQWSDKIKNNIFFPGMLLGEAKWGAYYGCEAFCLPSHQENFGIAIVEALACRKPVLISNQVNIWPEIAAGNAGIIGEDNFIDTKRVLYDWLELSTAEKNVMGSNAIATFKKNFAVAPMLKKWRTLLATSSNDVQAPQINDDISY